ncbi:MAG: hypothetical protein V3W41_08950 [Planctomycetota bacterium]
MNKLLLTLLCSGLWMGLLPAQDLAYTRTANAAPIESGAIPLKHKTLRSWKLVLPQEQLTLVGTGFHFQNTLGQFFGAKPEGTSLRIDVDGDGKMDVTVENEGALITLEGKNQAAYALRVVPSPKGWAFRPAHVRQGKIGKTKIQLIDQNNNGRFNDFGEDAMVIGRGRFASFLSKVVNIDGALFKLSVAKDGSEMRTKAFEGAQGILDVASGHQSKAKLLGAVVKSSDGRYSFELSRAKEGLKVPAGPYKLINGQLGIGKNVVKFRSGKSKSILVAADQKTPIGWGGPVKANFDYARESSKVTLSPDRVWYWGDLGEEYYDWSPLGKSPKFTILNNKTGKEIALAYFPGS